MRVTIRAEPTLDAIPPEADAAGAAARDRRRLALDVVDDRHPHAGGVAHALDVGQDHERIGRDQVADQRGELIVVAELDLLGRDRVVLVDDRDHAVVEQRAQGEPRRQEPAAVAEVVVGDQDLADREVVDGERVLPVLHQPALADRRRGLQRRQIVGASGKPQPPHAERDRARADHQDLDVAPAQLGDLVGDRGGPAGRALGEQPAADLDHHAARLGELIARAGGRAVGHRTPAAIRARHRRSKRVERGVEERVALGRQLDLDRGDRARQEAGLAGERGLDRLVERVDRLGVGHAGPPGEQPAHRAAGREVGELQRSAQRGARGRQRAAAERVERQRARRLVDRAADLLAQGQRGGRVDRQAGVEPRAVVVEQRHGHERPGRRPGAIDRRERDQHAARGASRRSAA